MEGKGSSPEGGGGGGTKEAVERGEDSWLLLLGSAPREKGGGFSYVSVSSKRWALMCWEKRKKKIMVVFSMAVTFTRSVTNDSCRDKRPFTRHAEAIRKKTNL